MALEETQKYEIIKKLVETNGSKQTTALRIGCTPRHINHLILGYKVQGKEFFSHSNHKHKPSPPSLLKYGAPSWTFKRISAMTPICPISRNSYRSMKELQFLQAWFARSLDRNLSSLLRQHVLLKRQSKRNWKTAKRAGRYKTFHLNKLRKEPIFTKRGVL